MQAPSSQCKPISEMKDGKLVEVWRKIQCNQCEVMHNREARPLCRVRASVGPAEGTGAKLCATPRRAMQTANAIEWLQETKQHTREPRCSQGGTFKVCLIAKN